MTHGIVLALLKHEAVIPAKKQSIHARMETDAIL